MSRRGEGRLESCGQIATGDKAFALDKKGSEKSAASAIGLRARPPSRRQKIISSGQVNRKPEDNAASTADVRARLQSCQRITARQSLLMGLQPPSSRNGETFSSFGIKDILCNFLHLGTA